MGDVFTNDLDTSNSSDYHTQLYIAIVSISVGGLAVAMFGIGCLINLDDISRKEMRLPQSVMIGLGLQYFIQPLVGYLLALLLNMEIYDALAMVILSVCPVSPFCAVLVYYGGGSILVGLTLSMFSTALSIGLIPFWFAFYSSPWSHAYYVIGNPLEIVITEIAIFLPTALGVIFKKFAGEKRANKVARVCTCAFLLTITICPILNGINNPEHYVGTWQIWVGGILLPFVGFVCGLIMASLFRLPYESCSAVTLAVGTPNWFIATTMAWRYFSDDVDALHEVLTLVSIFSISMPIEGLIWSMTYYGFEELIRKLYPKIATIFDDPDEEKEVKGASEGNDEENSLPGPGKGERVMYILGQVLDDDEVYEHAVADPGF